MIELDIDQLRAETPGTESVIHFNAAGAALPTRAVLTAQTAHLELEAQMGGYEAAAREAARADRMYAATAQLINADPDEIACMENATAAWMQAFYGIAATFKPGDRILTAVAEYGANYVAYLQAQKRTGCVIDVVPNDGEGRLDVAALESMMDDRVKLISITHVPTNGGLVNPAREVGMVARKHGVPYLLDACQSVGQMPIDVDEIGCDFLSVTGRKFLRGPRGIGFLYAKKAMWDRFEPGCIDHSGAKWTSATTYELLPNARRYENWEFNYAAKIGFGVALDEALALGMEAVQARITQLADRLRTDLLTISGLSIGDLGPNPCGIVTFGVEGLDPTHIKQHLAEKRINVSVTKVSSTRLDMEAREISGMVRVSPHVYNTEAECDMLISAVKDAVKTG